MSSSPILRGVFHQLRENWGTEDSGYVFENGPAPIGWLDVAVYRPTGTDPMTSFVTVGMAAAAMPDAPGPHGGGRVELRFARRGPLSPAAEYAIAAQLADIAVHPWRTGQQVNWGHMIGIDRDFPTFAGCRTIFCTRPFTQDTPDFVHVDAEPVRLVTVVPITDTERWRARSSSPADFLGKLLAEVDIFEARPDLEA
ncbi:suppressor of fused domain protein [Nocardia sp. NPDC127579]|uniref:suppressor of fused domain protein n=1 Tax=Nocardia sp. NPDC127579 TaxID=3345402 RepID=UPI003638EF2F